MPKKRKQKKKNGNAPTVEVETPKQGNEKEGEYSVSKSPDTPIPDAGAKPAPSFQIDPKMAKLAKQFGIPIDQIIEYAQVQDARITQLENVINKLGVKLEPVIALGEKIKAAQARGPGPTSPNPTAMPQGGGTLGQILNLLGPVLGSGGGVDEEMRALNKRMMEMSLSRMQADIGFTEAIKTAIVTKLSGKAAADLAV